MKHTLDLFTSSDVTSLRRYTFCVTIYKVKTICSFIMGNLQEHEWKRTLQPLYLSPRSELFLSHCFCCLLLLTFLHSLSSSTWSPLVSGCFCCCVGCLPLRTVTKPFTANNLHTDCGNERQAAVRRWMNNLALVGCVARIDTANPYSKAPVGCQRCGFCWVR